MTDGGLSLGAVPARLEEREREITAGAARPQPAAPPTPKLPEHPACQQIIAVFTATDQPLRARQVCEALDLPVAPNNINNTRLKFKRLADRGILIETEPGLPRR
ncbi:hypothetical protein [Streptomyces sp. NPDC050548]|uniref:hypothetical protein n=1 Tax=Streptomyces sp. NPDC050548 TaxID=3365629 RepID=UPI0037A2107D